MYYSCCRHVHDAHDALSMFYAAAWFTSTSHLHIKDRRDGLSYIFASLGGITAQSDGQTHSLPVCTRGSYGIHVTVLHVVKAMKESKEEETRLWLPLMPT